MTVGTFRDFELALEWKVSPGANSGVKYNVSEEMSVAAPPFNAALGFEYQILDDDLEAIGDIIETNLVTLGRERLDSMLEISPMTMRVLDEFHSAVYRAYDLALVALTQKDEDAAHRVRKPGTGLGHHHEAGLLRGDGPFPAVGLAVHLPRQAAPAIGAAERAGGRGDSAALARPRGGRRVRVQDGDHRGRRRRP